MTSNESIPRPAYIKIILLTIFVGFGGALGAIILHVLIQLVTSISFGFNGAGTFISSVESLPVWYRVFLPALGGLLVGVVIHTTKAYDASGEGVPEVLSVLALRGGKINRFVAPIKILTSTLTIGTGGSAGREGPIIQIGAGIGSLIGQYFKLDTRELKMLLGAGAAAGIGGTFGAPLAGVIFCSEILFRKLPLIRYGQFLLTGLIGAYVTTFVIGQPVLAFNFLGEVSFLPQDLVTIVVLGILAGVVAVLFGYCFRITTKVFTNLPIHYILKPALGGLLVGLIALLFPYVHEPASYPFILNSLSEVTLPFYLLLALLIAKIVATSITLGSGGSGGIFAPALFIGCILGSSFGAVLENLPFIAVDSTLLILLGMASLFAGVAHAPFTASIIVFELTDEPLLIIPLILSTIAAYSVASRLHPLSLYGKRSD